MTTSVLEIIDLHLNFPSESGPCPILNGVSFDVKHGEIFALVGESGCGKSITAQTILQLQSSSAKITKGQILFDGIPLHTRSEKEMRSVRGSKIGMIFQDPMTSLNPTLTIGWQIAESLIYNLKYSKREAKAATIKLLAEVGIPDPASRYDSYPFQLSGGMRQRVMIALAMACRPLLLIADEPTTALDVTIQAQILSLFQEIRDKTGMSIILITHDLGIVAGVCDRAAVMQHGKIVETEKVETLFASPQHPYTKALLNARATSYTLANK